MADWTPRGAGMLRKDSKLRPSNWIRKSAITPDAETEPITEPIVAASAEAPRETIVIRPAAPDSRDAHLRELRADVARLKDELAGVVAERDALSDERAEYNFWLENICSVQTLWVEKASAEAVVAAEAKESARATAAVNQEHLTEIARLNRRAKIRRRRGFALLVLVLLLGAGGMFYYDHYYVPPRPCVGSA